MNRNQGFTIIELMLAILLSTMLILIAFTVFRSVTRTVKDIEDLREQNQLIRAGYFLVVDDADYWHSHANPSFPYLRGHGAQTDDSNSAYDKRPMRPVVWSDDLNDPENPNWAQPHDERSWYRNHLMPGVSTGEFIYSPSQGVSKYFFIPDFVYDATDDELELQRAGTGFDTKRYFPGRMCRPKAWETWHIVGDYAALSNIDQGVVPELQTDHDKVAGARPRQLWHAFKELGIQGVYNYTRPGSPNLILASTLNQTQENYTDIDKRIDTHFRKGEIPWSLNAHDNLATVRQMGVRVGPREPDDFVTYPESFATTYPDFNRSNYGLFLPSYLDGGRFDGLAWRPLPLFADLDIFIGDVYARNVTELTGLNQNGGTIYPMALYYADNPLLKTVGGKDFDWYEFDKDVAFPISMQDVTNNLEFQKAEQLEWGNSQRFSMQRHFRDIRLRHEQMTWHVPSNYTGDPEPDLYVLEEGQQALATKVYRYRHNGNDRAYCSVVLADRQGNKAFELRMRVLGSSFRGARQHWGRKAGATGVDDGFGRKIKLGDRYE